MSLWTGGVLLIGLAATVRLNPGEYITQCPSAIGRPAQDGGVRSQAIRVRREAGESG